jgi:phosphoserine phosphatase
LVRVLLAGFDMDGTLLEENSSWVALHRHFGTSEKGEASLELYSEGKINYIEFMRRDIASWPSDVTIKEVDRILSRYKLRREAPHVIERLRKNGIEVAVITSGIDLLAEKVSRALGIRHWTANGLEVDEEGRLTGEGIGRVDPTRKDLAYLKLLKSLGIHRKKTIAVGDTVYDLRFLKTAWKGFLLSRELDLSEHSIIKIEKLTDIFLHI